MHSANETTEGPDAPICLICLDEEHTPTPFEFPCGCKAPFHAECIDRWHSQKEKEDVCPICRVGPVAPESVAQAFPHQERSDGLDGARFCVNVVFFGYIGWMVGLLILNAAQ